LPLQAQQQLQLQQHPPAGQRTKYPLRIRQRGIRRHKEAQEDRPEAEGQEVGRAADTGKQNGGWWAFIREEDIS